MSDRLSLKATGSISGDLVSAEVAKPSVIKSIRLLHSVPFNGREEDTIRMGPGHCVRYWAIRIEADGSAVPISANQRCDGFALECDRHNRVTLKTEVERVVVLNSGIRAIVY